MFIEDEFQLNAIHYLDLELTCSYLPSGAPLKKSRYLFPDTIDITGEEHFAQVYGGWNEEGLFFCVEGRQGKGKSFYPEVTKGESVELFLDTRDVKSSGYTTRYCHHFAFLPQEVDGVDRGELTHFRTEDRHERCEPHELGLEVLKKKNRYEMQIFIPSHCLHGYDGGQFKRLGFSYRINRYQAESQHFSAVTGEFQVEQQPSLWSTMRLES